MGCCVSPSPALLGATGALQQVLAGGMCDKCMQTAGHSVARQPGGSQGGARGSSSKHVRGSSPHSQKNHPNASRSAHAQVLPAEPGSQGPGPRVLLSLPLVRQARRSSVCAQGDLVLSYKRFYPFSLNGGRNTLGKQFVALSRDAQ